MRIVVTKPSCVAGHDVGHCSGTREAAVPPPQPAPPTSPDEGALPRLRQTRSMDVDAAWLSPTAVIYPKDFVDASPGGGSAEAAGDEAFAAS